MGSLTVPPSGLVVIESSTLIYLVERHPIYGPLVAPLWEAAAVGQVELAASALIITETLVFPFRTGDTAAVADYETALFRSELRLLSVHQGVLLTAARLRATLNLRTPDAIHAATALEAGATALVTNDPHLRRVPGLTVTILDDCRNQ